jgi:large subunit ribosomal protein L2
MPLKSFKPVTPANRYKMLPGFDEITKSKPEKSLLEVKKRSGGRNNQGRITCRHIGGGHKKKYRLVDFKRNKRDQVAEVVGIEYDPNRTCRIALLKYEDGTKSYILAPSGLTDGDKVVSGESVEPKVGNAMPLKNVPLGTAIHNIELRPGSGGKVARSAGQQAILQSREGGYAFIKMPSGELRKFHEESYATIGTVGNRDHMKEISGKAGRTRWQGKRPSCSRNVHEPRRSPERWW